MTGVKSFFPNERDRFSWFVCCMNLKCKVDTHTTNRLGFCSEGFNLRAKGLEKVRTDTDTTKVCLVCFSEKESKISLEGNKTDLQKDALPTRVA